MALQVRKPAQLIPLGLEGLRELADFVVEVIGSKNKLYKDSWQAYGAASVFIHIADKFRRLEFLLTESEASAKDIEINESVVDTVADLTAYCLLFLWWLHTYLPEQFNMWRKKQEDFVKKVKEILSTTMARNAELGNEEGSISVTATAPGSLIGGFGQQDDAE